MSSDDPDLRRFQHFIDQGNDADVQQYESPFIFEQDRSAPGLNAHMFGSDALNNVNSGAYLRNENFSSDLIDPYDRVGFSNSGYGHCRSNTQFPTSSGSFNANPSATPMPNDSYIGPSIVNFTPLGQRYVDPLALRPSAPQSAPPQYPPAPKYRPQIPSPQGPSTFYQVHQELSLNDIQSTEGLSRLGRGTNLQRAQNILSQSQSYTSGNGATNFGFEGFAEPYTLNPSRRSHGIVGFGHVFQGTSGHQQRSASQAPQYHSGGTVTLPFRPALHQAAQQHRTLPQPPINHGTIPQHNVNYGMAPQRHAYSDMSYQEQPKMQARPSASRDHCRGANISSTGISFSAPRAVITQTTAVNAVQGSTGFIPQIKTEFGTQPRANFQAHVIVNNQANMSSAANGLPVNNYVNQEDEYETDEEGTIFTDEEDEGDVIDKVDTDTDEEDESAGPDKWPKKCPSHRVFNESLLQMPKAKYLARKKRPDRGFSRFQKAGILNVTPITVLEKFIAVSNKDCLFFKLPPEIRNMIYILTLGGNVVRPQMIHSYTSPPFLILRCGQDAGLYVLLTCRQMYAETAWLRWANNIFCFDGLHAVKSMIRGLSTYQSKAITRIAFATDHPAGLEPYTHPWGGYNNVRHRSLLEEFPNLQQIDVCILKGNHLANFNYDNLKNTITQQLRNACRVQGSRFPCGLRFQIVDQNLRSARNHWLARYHYS